MENRTGLMQGYYIGLFARFLWFLFIAVIFQSVILYIFDYNWFTYIALSIIISFFINTSLPLGEGYPFVRHILINMSLYFALGETAPYTIEKLRSFFNPDTFWALLLLISFINGFIYAFGRYGNGSMSKNMESFTTLIGLVIIIVSFFYFWWEGAVLFVVFRVFLMMVEIFAAKLLLYMVTRKHEEQFIEQEIIYEETRN